MLQAQTQRNPDYISRMFILVVASMVLLTLAAVGSAGWWRDAPAPSTEVPRISLVLRFIEQPDGGLSVVDMATGREYDHLAAGENGFLRTMIRVIRRDILRTDATISMPFRIEAWQNNRVTLTDSATERRVDLRAFGPTNAEVFIRWLSKKEVRG
jgi:putative photosynthetic complex assembly protein